MISKAFLDKIIDFYVKDKSLLNNINMFVITNSLKYIFEHSTNEIPAILNNQYKFVKYLIDFEWDKYSVNFLIDNIYKSEMFKEFKELIDYLKDEKYTQHELDEFTKMLKIKEESIKIDTDKQKLEDFIDKYTNNTFESSEDMINEFQNLITTIHTRLLIKSDYFKNNESDFLFENEDDVNKCIEIIKEYRSDVNKVKTGMKPFDDVLKGGFQPKRVYILGGTPGVGKSLFSLDMLLKSLFNKENDEGLYIYITLENMITETLDRLYNMIPNYVDNINGPINNSKILADKIAEMRKYNKMLSIKYFQSYSTTVNDIMIYIDNLMNKTGLKPRMICVDYLDLLTSINKTELYRLELGYITMELKMLAIKYDIPILVPTQLNSSGYNDIPDLGSVTESKKKVEHADFVGILYNRTRIANKSKIENMSPDESDKVILFIRKNRNAPLRNIAFDVNYNKMKIVASDNTFTIKVNNSGMQNYSKEFEKASDFVNLF